MKLVIIFLSVLSVSCSSVNTELRNAISFGDIVELNEYSKNVDKQLVVRLFSSPVYKESCFIETHGVCQYQYFISVSTFDEYPDTNIFRLKETGEIREIKWLNSSGVDTAIIEFKIEKYTMSALQNNPKLVSEAKIINAILTPRSMKESLVSNR